MSAPCPVFGFTIRFHVANGTSDSARANLWSAFIAEVERLGLVCSGGGDAQWEHTICRDGSQTADVDRLALAAWCDARVEISDVELGPLVDLARVR